MCHVRGEGGVSTQRSHSLQYWPLIGQRILILSSHWWMSDTLLVLTLALFGDTGATWCYVLCSLASARTLQSTDRRLDLILTPKLGSQ